MNWGKTKTLLIVLLIAANLIAAFMYARLRYDKTMLPEEIVDGAVENLTSKGVKVQDGAIMRKKQNLAIYTAVKEKPEDCTEYLKKTLDTMLPEAGTYSEVAIPDGVGAVKTTETDETSAELTSNSLLTAVSGKLSEAERENICGVLRSVSDCEAPASADAAKMTAVKRFYSALCKNSKRGGADFGFRAFEVREYGGGEIIFCAQTADGVTLPEYISRFYFSPTGELALVYGHFFVGEAEKAYSATLLDGVNLIYKMNLENVSEIIGERDAFSVIAIEGDNFYFVPSYSVIYKDKKGNIANHIYDSVTGELKSRI